MKLGICMGGGEQEFLDVIKRQMTINPVNPFTYLEIGVAYGETLKGVWGTIKSPNTRAIGIDLPKWEGVGSIIDRFNGEPFTFGPMGTEVPYGSAGLILERSEVALLDHSWGYYIDVAFIDGCHAKACAMIDFLALERRMKVGGIVIFHDAGEKEQGAGAQPHCHEPMNVRAALVELGLLGSMRKGWEFIGMIPTENNCAVFKKTE